MERSDSQENFLRKIPRAAGSYVIVLELTDRFQLTIGGLGPRTFEPGRYLYVGSARGPGGLRGRLKRHLSGGAVNKHWHIDYLRSVGYPVALFLALTPDRRECAWSIQLQQVDQATGIPGFGCTDCHCPSHLFHTVERLPALKRWLAPYDQTLRVTTDLYI